MNGAPRACGEEAGSASLLLAALASFLHEALPQLPVGFANHLAQLGIGGVNDGAGLLPVGGRPRDAPPPVVADEDILPFPRDFSRFGGFLGALLPGCFALVGRPLVSYF